MSGDFDLVVRGGMVAAGDGGEPVRQDVAIRGGVIRQVGEVRGRGAEELDADGHLVTPGFVDVHTHYDGQVIWDSDLAPSSVNGVTTVVMGNCGVGFAPCRAEDRARVIGLMEAVEDIPEVVMAEGLDWDWETFPEYLRAIEKRPHTIDMAAYLPHSALRVYAMGQRGAERGPADDDDLAKLRALANEAMQAGALGFATSRNIVHKTLDGDPIPSFAAADRELEAIAAGLKDAGRGVLQALPDYEDLDREFDLFERLVGGSGRPLSYSLVQLPDRPGLWRHALDRTAQANRKGLPIRAQVIGRPTGILLGLNLSYNPFSFYPSYRKIARLPLAQRLVEMRRPDFRDRLLSETPGTPELPVLAAVSAFHMIAELGDPPCYEPTPEAMVTRRAAAQGVSPAALAYDLLLKDEGRSILFVPMANYAEGNLDAVFAMMKDENTILGLGDGGAHYGLLCDSSYPTFMLTYWCRDRAGAKLSVGEVVRELSAAPAEAVGLNDRGRIAPGYKGDLNVIDFERLKLTAPYAQYDLPAHGRRLMQGAHGIRATVVSGQAIYRDGQATGAHPGRLVRGATQASDAGPGRLVRRPARATA
jgi:N-acyl-D-aspartate/D-glutamate deacylase